MNLTKSSKDRFLAIDANAIVHRAFHAYPSTLQTEDGIQVNAVYGFTVMLMTALKIFEPRYVLCCFDTHKPTFRHTEYTEYKANRKPRDQSLIDQFPLVEDVLKAFNIPILKKEGYEADDLLGTISKYVKNGKWSNENLELYILSGDRDLLQLVDEDIKTCLPSGNFSNLVAYDSQKTYEYMGLYPHQIVDYKAIAGDTSDNIPGVKGVGSKTAIQLLNQYGTLDNIYKNLKDVKPRYAELLLEGVEIAELSRKLATIEQEVGLNIHLEDCVMKDFNKSDVQNIFKKYSFKSLLKKLDEIKEDERDSNTSQLDIFNVQTEVAEWSRFEDVKEDILTSESLKIIYISSTESLLGECMYFVETESAKYLLKNIPHISIVAKSILTYGWEEICDIFEYSSETKIFDIQIFAHAVSAEKRSFTLKDLSFDYSSKQLKEKISPSDMGTLFESVDEIASSLKQKANGIELYEYTKNSIREFLGFNDQYFLNVHNKVDVPTAKVLKSMEQRGIKIDIEYLAQFNNSLFKDIENKKGEIYDSIGHEFNINSPKQLADIIYNELGLKKGSKMSTRESLLIELVGLHPCIEKILEYRELTKIQGTYTEPLLRLARESEDGSIHTDFKLTGTTSGRLSSVNPNMQNIPAQGKYAEGIRRAFVARDGFKLLGMDYSQMELRIMADMSRDDLLIKDFKDGLDIHTSTASRILNKEFEEISKKERSIGKTVNFGILFGQSAFGLSRMLKIPREDAFAYIQAYFNHYIGVEQYIRNLEKEAYKRGYVQTMFGTTRNISGIKTKNISMQKAAQREAVNMPIQGSEADIMKLAMVNLHDLIQKKYSGKAFILLQVHDELVFEVSEEVAKEFEGEAKHILTDVVSLEVPLEVSSAVGKYMSELK